jgi:hypothetical protein
MRLFAPVLKECLDIFEGNAVLEVEASPGRATLSGNVGDAGESWQFYVESFDVMEDVIVFLYPPFSLPAAQYAEGCRLVNEINWQLRHGHFEIGAQKGVLRYVLGTDFTHLQPDGKTIATMVSMAATAAEDWMIALKAVCLCGETAVQALAAQARHSAANDSSETIRIDAPADAAAADTPGA